MTGPRVRRPCDVPWFPHGLRKARPYACGWRCNRHAPWAVAGQEEPKPRTTPLPGAWTTPSPISDSRVHDARAIASGKRRASPEAFRAAQAAVGARPEPGIRLDPGRPDARGGWIRLPTADYTCPACGQTESASGDQVAHFAAHIEDEHRERCTANRNGGALPGTAAPHTESSNS